MGDHPRTVDEIYHNHQARYRGILSALTVEHVEFFNQCDPASDNLCLYGEPDGSWVVEQPAEELPAELPEPVLGINFCRDGMGRRDWLALVAVHSDAWLLSVAFHYGTKLDAASRMRLFKAINRGPTLYETIMLSQRHPALKNGVEPAVQQQQERPAAATPHQQPGPAQSADEPHPAGRLATMQDCTQDLVGRQAQMFWPDDKKWYLIQIDSVEMGTRKSTVQYTSGEIEILDLADIIRDRQMFLLPPQGL